MEHLIQNGKNLMEHENQRDKTVCVVEVGRIMAG